MLKTVTNSTPTLGYFVVLGEEEKTSLKQLMAVDNGRSGVFYKKEELVTTLKSNSALKGRKMDIVEILVPPGGIINPNCKKFMILGGKNIPIIEINPFSFKKVIKKEEIKETVAEVA